MITGDYASVCLQTLERPEALERCLSSLWENTSYPHELLVHDDGSTDSRVWMLLVEAQKCAKISTLILGNPPGYNTGPGVPFHRLFHCSHGKYIVKVDADLEFRPGWLEYAVGVFEHFPEVVWLGLVPWPKEDLHTYIDTQGPRGMVYLVERHWAALTTAFMVRRAQLDAAYPHGDLPEFDLAFSDDVKVMGAVFRDLCLCRDGNRPPMGGPRGGWLGILPRELSGVVPIPGAGTTVNILVGGKAYRRPIHSHPWVLGDLKAYPEVALTRRFGVQVSLPLAAGAPPPLELTRNSRAAQPNR